MSNQITEMGNGAINSILSYKGVPNTTIDTGIEMIYI